MTRVARAALVAALAATVAVASLMGCARKGPVFVDNDAAHTKTTVLSILAQADASAVESRPTVDGTKLRHDALAALRSQGPAASSAADLLTRTFPSDTSGVPVHVERGTYEGKPALIVVEATGPASGSLNSKRLWVVADNGDILFAGSR